MEKRILFIVVFACFLLMNTGCSKKLLISSGAKSNEPLIFNNEYTIKELDEIEVNGSAFWGIPSFKKNNRNNHKQGMLVTFNGIEVFKTKRIYPILTLLGYTALTQSVVGSLLQDPEDFFYDGPNYSLASLLISVPIAGTLNNLTWKNSALSGASQTFNYWLLDENPNVDVFFYPKYEITRKDIFSDDYVNFKYLWFQDATLKGRVKGATLKTSLK